MIKRTDRRSFRLAAVAALLTTAVGLAVLCADGARAEGDLAVRPIKLDPLVLGTDMIGFNVSVQEYNLETGQAYRLLIKASGFQEYAMVAPEFFNNIWLRKVEAGGIEIKATGLYELEFEDEGEAELFFVPIRPGSYEFYAKGLKDKGTFVTVNVK